MACMFTMMNRARLAVGLQGVGIAERATQQALAYARERKQGAAGAIIAYPDVKRMLLTMRSLTAAARAICYATGIAIDRSLVCGDDHEMCGVIHTFGARHSGCSGGSGSSGVASSPAPASRPSCRAASSA